MHRRYHQPRRSFSRRFGRFQSWLDVLRDAENLCPQAIVLNYTNPMSMLYLAADELHRFPWVGLIPIGAGHQPHLLATCRHPYELDGMGVRRHQSPRLVHQASSRRKGSLKYLEAEGTGGSKWQIHRRDSQKDLIRKDMMVHFGAFITESSGHLSEYPSLLPQTQGPDQNSIVARNTMGNRAFTRGTGRPGADERTRSGYKCWKGRLRSIGPEAGNTRAGLLSAREEFPDRVHGNVMNGRTGPAPLIANLPADGCVEVACLVDGNGIQPTRYGASRLHQVAALCATNMNVFDLGARARPSNSAKKRLFTP